jgi:hypothetical protein
MNMTPRFVRRLSYGLLLAIPSSLACAYTPSSPEVIALIDRAVPILEKEDHGEPGGKALISLALLKAGKEPSHPRIQRSIASIRSYVRSIPRNGIGNHCYSAAICCLLLTELDPQAYHDEIQILLDGLAARQLASGAWAYDPYTGYDDTSQSQYGVLALWAGHVHGFKIEASQVVSALNWFLRTQKPSGGWSYHIPKEGNLAAPSGGHDPTRSMSAAGAGSVYICGYLLGYGKRVEQKQGSLPPALRSTRKPTDGGEFLSPEGTDHNAFRNATTRAANYFAVNLAFRQEDWTHYYMYALERYKAFQSLIEGRPEAEPRWYNEGVDYLRKTQFPDGGWASGHAQSTESVSTAFAVLFLTRGTEKSIRKLEGRLQGGQGLPADLTQAAVDPSGRVIDTKEIPSIDLLLKQLESGDAFDVDLSVPHRLRLSDDPRQRSAQLERLRRMVLRGAYEVRRMAVNSIAQDRNLDNVPVLIFALSDPDHQVKRAARDGLCFISRKIEGFGPGENPTESETRAAQAKWKEWYLSLRPDGELIE